MLDVSENNQLFDSLKKDQKSNENLDSCETEEEKIMVMSEMNYYRRKDNNNTMGVKSFSNQNLFDRSTITQNL